jgi:hypothetical protein
VSLGSTTIRRWAGAAIAGIALALGVFVLLGILISPRVAVVRHAEDRIVAFYRTIVCGVWGVPVRGLVITRNPDQSISAVPGAIFCETDLASADGCHTIGESGPEGSFDFKVAFDFVSTDGSTEKQEEKALLVTAPGCTPHELRVRDRRAPYQVILDCPNRSIGPPAAPAVSVSALSSST